jgi:methionine biosynthesis protein MetW
MTNTSDLIDDPNRNDNRQYEYPPASRIHRTEYPVICDMIPAGSSVVDFGCGDGSLLDLLREKKGIQGVGIDISPSGVNAAKKKGFSVFLHPIDKRCPDLQGQEFDFAICNVTLQMVMYPEIVLEEMVRLGRKQIVSFPNFAYYRNRRDLLVNGRMPRPMLFGYDWYSTGHIHQFSYRDFTETASKMGLKITQAEYLETRMDGIRGVLTRRYPNLFAMYCVLLLEKSP